MGEPARRPLATRSEVIEYMHVSEQTFNRHVAPTLPPIAFGTGIRYDWEDVSRWVESHKGGASASTHEPESISSASATKAGSTAGRRAKSIESRLRRRQLESTKK